MDFCSRILKSIYEYFKFFTAKISLIAKNRKFITELFYYTVKTR